MLDTESLSNKAKLLLKFFDTENHYNNTEEKLIERSGFTKAEIHRALNELNRSFIAGKTTVFSPKNGELSYYTLILSEEEIAKLQVFQQSKEESDVTHTISFSRLELLKQSPRRFYLRYVKGIKIPQEPSVALEFGTFVHDLIEHSFTKSEEDFNDLVENRVHLLLEEFPEEIREDVSLRFYNVIPYLKKLRGRYEVIELEKQIVVPVRDYSNDPHMQDILTEITPKRYRPLNKKIYKVAWNGYVDAWMKEGDKRVVIDWKTGSYSNLKYTKHSRQVQVYAHLLRMVGENPDVGRIHYIEAGIEKDVNIDPEICERVFEEMLQEYLDHISQGVDADNFKGCCPEKLKNWCEYAQMCRMLDHPTDDILRRGLLTWTS